MKKALLQMHLAVLLWGFTGVLGVAITLDAPALVWYRTLLTAAITAIILVFRKEWRKIAPNDMITLIGVGALMAIHWVAFYGSIKFANASIALVCLSTASVFTSAFDTIFNKVKFKPVEMLLGLIALIGVACIYQFQVGYAKGIIWGVVAAILSSIFTILNKRIAHKYPARLMVFCEMTSGWVVLSIILGLLVLFGGNHLLTTSGQEHLRMLPTANDWIWLLLLSLCCTVWAQNLALNALKHLSSFTVTLSVNLEPVYGVILAFLFYHENKNLGWGFYTGLGLIMLSVVIQMLRLLRPSMLRK